jgi:hypothetical protein
MRKKLKKKKIFVKLEDVPHFLNKDLPTSLISKKSGKMFTRFGICSDFLQLDPINRNNNNHYVSGKKKLNL